MAEFVAPEPKAEPAGGLYDQDGRPRPQASVLIEIGNTHHLFHDQGGDAYARANVGTRAAVMSVDGREYREVLGRAYYVLSGKGGNRNSVRDAVSTLAATARYAGPQEPVFLRVADVPGGGIALDIGDDTGDAITVTADGWEIGAAPVNFRRSGKPLALPRPTAANFGLIWRYVNVAAEDRPLVAAWLLAALRPRGPYPILLLIGEQGTGKTFASRVLKRLTDPSAVMLRPPPRDEKDLQVAAVSSWCVALDNLSGLNPQLSDCLCRLSTGGGFAGRKLYTDCDETLFEIQRPLIVNGIDDIASRPDLADRCLHLLLPPLTTRGTEAELERSFQSDAPAIFAALLDALALATRDHASVRLEKPPRMIDFATWAAAGIAALGFAAAEFTDAYTRNREHLAEAAIEASPVASALVQFMSARDSWTGSSLDLLGRLADIAPNAAAGQAWPRTAKGLLEVLRRVAPALRAAGITAEHHRSRLTRTVTVCKGRFNASQASQGSRHQLDPSDNNKLRTSGSASQASPNTSQASRETRIGDACDACDALEPALHGGHQEASEIAI